MISRSAIVAWSSVVLWAFLLWGFQVMQQEWEPIPSFAAPGVLEGVRPPVFRRSIVWADLYPDRSTESSRPRGTVPPRIWPVTYADASQRKPRAQSPHHRGTKLVELRHLPSYPKTCRPKSKWHTFSFPTCNQMHELDFASGLVPPSPVPFVDEDDSGSDNNEVFVEYKFSGASRSSWLVHTICTDGDECVAPGFNATKEKRTGPQVILKTLNWEMEYDEVVFDHQRIDALASERLTSSPHVIDIFGFCGGSAINEFADGGSFGRMVRRMNDTEASIPPERLLVYARDAALGLADVHEIDGRGNVTTLIHHDFAAKNLLTVGGKLKVSDFNDGQLLRWDSKLNRRCNGFFWDGKCGSTRERTHRRSPEECMGDRYRRYTTEKVEVYHLGSLLFYLLTEGGWPYSFETNSKGLLHKPRSPKVRKNIINGELPALPAEVTESNNTATKALIQAMKWAYTFSPNKRPSARAVGKFLDEKLEKLQGSLR